MVPWNAVATGPVISTWPSARHSMSISPPSATICTRRPVNPRRAALTAVAHAPDPQAKVSPAPRSHTFSRTRFGPISCANPIFAPSGNIASCSRDGPSRVTFSVSTSSTNQVACGLPIDSAAGSPGRSTCNVSIGRASGTSRQSKRGAPMSTQTRPSGSTTEGSGPAIV
jgi:hypothetical protein